VAVDRTSKVAFASVYRRATSLVAAAFLTVLARAVPYRIHTVLTDDAIKWRRGGPPRVRAATTRSRGRPGTPFRAPPETGRRSAWCARKKRPPSGAFQYDDIAGCASQVADYLTAYNQAKHLKALRWRTPVETLEALWASEGRDLPTITRPPHPGTEHLVM
jgi:hypothetical protein